MVKFTFKKQPKETGLASVGNPWQNVDIKHNKKIVGTIYAPNWMSKDGKWRVSVMVETESGKWEWRTFKVRFDDEQSARKWVQEHAEALVNMKLHHEEPEDY